MIESSNAIFFQVRKARNDIMHTSNMKLSASEFNVHTKAMIDLLTDPSIKKIKSAQLAVTEIKKVSIHIAYKEAHLFTSLNLFYIICVCLCYTDWSFPCILVITC